MDITKFNEKLNKVEGNTYVIEEVVTPVDGVYEAELVHDNVNLTTLNVYTGSKLTGDKINTYNRSTPSLAPWKTLIKIYSNISPLYISYETSGDQVEAGDINNIQDAIVDTQENLNSEVTRATNVEKVLTDNLNAEINRAKGTENTITVNLNSEISRAKSAENTLTNNLNSEVTRANNAENALTSNLNSEINRAKAAENTITNFVNSNKPNWDDKYTRNEIDNKFNVYTTNLDWKESVATFNDIATTYPTPDDGWTVNVKDTDYTYRWNGSKWDPISANSIPLATKDVDGKMSKQDKIDHDDMVSKRHTHPNKGILDVITQALLDAWNAAYTHISDAVRHITGAERTLWNNTANTVANGTVNNSEKLDGLDSSQFLRKDTYDASNTMKLFSAPMSSQDDYINSPISIRERGLVGNSQSDDKYAPNLNFHWGGVIARSLAMRHDGNLYYGEYDWNGNPPSDLIWHSGNDGKGSGLDADTVDGLHSTDFARAYSSGVNFGGSNTAITTTDFIKLLTNLGAFNQPYWVARGGWYYAGNNYISDTGIGNIHLAGATVEVIGNSDVYTIRIHTPTTSASGVVNTEFIYVNNGSDYLPGWRKIWNDKNDGAGSGLDADLLDGRHASDFAPSGYGIGTNGVNISNSDLNTIQTTGFYIGEKCSNAPNTGWFYFIVISHTDTNWTCQYAISYSAGNTGNLLYTRIKVNGSWSAWANYYSNTNKPTPSDIGTYTKIESDNKFATKNEISIAGYGDMLKSVYDKNGDGIIDNSDTVDGKHASDFAPSGFGLGEYMHNKPINDANNAAVTGFYYCTGAANCPNGAGDGNLMVLAYSDSYVHQMFFEYNEAENGRIFMRKRNNGTWRSWYQVARIGDINNAVNDIRIGGRNLLRNSGKFKDLSYWGLHTYGLSNSNNLLPLTLRNDIWSGNEPAIEVHLSHIDGGEYGVTQTVTGLTVNRQYTLSGYIAGHRSAKNIIIRDTTGGWITNQYMQSVYGGSDLNNWSKINITFTATTSTVQIEFDIIGMDGGDDGYIWLKYLKLEEGNKATSWTPAIEDMVQKGMTWNDLEGI